MINFRKKAVAMLLATVFTAGMLSGCGTSVDTEKSKNDSRKAVEQTTQAEADTNSKTQNEEDKSESRDIFAMDTYMTLTAYGKNAKKALDEAVDEINNIEQLVSTGIDSSEVSQINKNGKGSVSETTGYLIKRSKEIYDSTNGVFDITIYPIMQAWGFPTENYRVPGKKELKKLRGLMGADHVLYDEKDKGAFDAVTRATTNHGLHRGSYQCTAVIKTAEGEYSVSHWSSNGKTVYFTDGTSAGWNRGTLTLTDGTTQTMTEYDVLGLKYVPVKVKSSDYASFKEKYSVVENNGTLIGGYGEKNLQDYNVTASVDKDTNGLKTAEKQSDGSFTFTQRSNGSSSGIKDKTLKTADLNNMGATVKDASGSYGEFLRVDFTKDYGDLGANMQAVKWTYYGNDSTRSKALATYGTKFAADNWMHKSMGIQLGLTNSIRCQLPKGYDGTGYWSLTIYALGYDDSTYNFEATDANFVP